MFPDTGNGKRSEASTSTGMSQRCCQFEFDEILLATDNFNESLVVGKGGFGKVYKGNIKIGTTHVDVAIKRLDLMSNQGATEFWAEVEMLSKLRHAHLVSLIGYCNYEKEMILVYEYMPHGTLEDHLHKLHTPLSWLERLKICIGAARGLDYLHTGTGIEIGVIHRDVKSSNILLHDSQVAKISDFGLARIGPKNQPSTNVYTLVKGTFGYIDPNYFATGKLTRKSDVYAFGVVLFEVLCQKRPLDESFECGLATWIQESIKEGNLKHIVYSGIRSEISPKCLKGFARIAERCLDDHPNHRPTMTEVVFSLESLLAQSVLSSQQKTNNWLQTSGKKIFGRIFNVFPFSSPGENSDRDIRRSGSELNSQNVSDLSMESPGSTNFPSFSLRTSNLRVFTFSELKTATKNFSLSAKIGEGGFGCVYTGVIKNPRDHTKGIKVAVKQLGITGLQGHKEWVTEVNVLGVVEHPNIVKLIGYCAEDDERGIQRLLVYEYMPNRSVEDHLSSRSGETLSWAMRLKVAQDAARGLTYLHEEMDFQIIFRDFKSSNILLDENWNAKLSNFGMARLGPQEGLTHVSTAVVGTMGYAAPEYIRTGRLTSKSDLWGYGVFLYELITGRHPLDKNRPKNEQKLLEWVKPYLDSKKFRLIIDSRLEGKYSLKSAQKLSIIANRCLSRNPKSRPKMSEVLEMVNQLIDGPSHNSPSPPIRSSVPVVIEPKNMFYFG